MPEAPDVARIKVHLWPMGTWRASGKKHWPEWSNWAHMLQRCGNWRATGYEKYGGKGICVSPVFYDFDAFITHIGRKPSPEHSIDRYPDPYGNYEPGNVRWATRSEQRKNQRSRPRMSAEELADRVEQQSEKARLMRASMTEQEKEQEREWHRRFRAEHPLTAEQRARKKERDRPQGRGRRAPRPRNKWKRSGRQRGFTDPRRNTGRTSERSESRTSEPRNRRSKGVPKTG